MSRQSTPTKSIAPINSLLPPLSSNSSHGINPQLHSSQHHGVSSGLPPSSSSSSVSPFIPRRLSTGQILARSHSCHCLNIVTVLSAPERESVIVNTNTNTIDEHKLPSVQSLSSQSPTTTDPLSLTAPALLSSTGTTSLAALALAHSNNTNTTTNNNNSNNNNNNNNNTNVESKDHKDNKDHKEKEHAPVVTFSRENLALLSTNNSNSNSSNTGAGGGAGLTILEQKLFDKIFFNLNEPGLRRDKLVGTLESKTIEQKSLVSCRALGPSGAWTIFRCDNCKIDVFALSRFSKRTIINSKLKFGDEIVKLHENDNYSPVFGIIIRLPKTLPNNNSSSTTSSPTLVPPTNSSNSSSNPSSSSTSTTSSSLSTTTTNNVQQTLVEEDQTLSRCLRDAINAEKVAMEARISQFTRRETEKFRQYEQRGKDELSRLSNILHETRIAQEKQDREGAQRTETATGQALSQFSRRGSRASPRMQRMLLSGVKSTNASPPDPRTISDLSDLHTLPDTLPSSSSPTQSGPSSLLSPASRNQRANSITHQNIPASIFATPPPAPSPDITPSIPPTSTTTTTTPTTLTTKSTAPPESSPLLGPFSLLSSTKTPNTLRAQSLMVTPTTPVSTTSSTTSAGIIKVRSKTNVDELDEAAIFKFEEDLEDAAPPFIPDDAEEDEEEELEVEEKKSVHILTQVQVVKFEEPSLLSSSVPIQIPQKLLFRAKGKQNENTNNTNEVKSGSSAVSETKGDIKRVNVSENKAMSPKPSVVPSSSVSSTASSVSTASSNKVDKLDEDELLENNTNKYNDDDEDGQQPFMPPHTLTETPNFWSFSNIKYMEKKKIINIATE